VVIENKGKAVVEKGSTSKRLRNYDHFHHKDRPTRFCKVILAPKLEWMSLSSFLTKYLPLVSKEFTLRTNTGFSWRVTARNVKGRLSLDKGWPPFVVIHKIQIGYMVTFKLINLMTMKVIFCNDEGPKVVTKCRKHKETFSSIDDYL